MYHKWQNTAVTYDVNLFMDDTCTMWWKVNVRIQLVSAMLLHRGQICDDEGKYQNIDGIPDATLLMADMMWLRVNVGTQAVWCIEGILPKGPYPPCLRMADRALLAGYPRYVMSLFDGRYNVMKGEYQNTGCVSDVTSFTADTLWWRVDVRTQVVFVVSLFWW